MWEKIQRNIYNLGLTNEEYENITPSICQTRVSVVKSLSYMCIILIGLLVIFSYQVSTLKGYRPFYISFFLISCLVYFAIQMLKSPEGILPRIIVHFYLLSALLFTIFIGTVCQPYFPATSICVLLIIIPLVIIERPFLIIGEIFMASVLTLIISYNIKTLHAFHIDVANVVCFFVVSCFTYWQVMTVKVVNMLNHYYKTKLTNKKLEEDLEQSRLQMMLSQIKPHFIFNVLNSISNLCLQNPDKANQGIITFSKYLRNNINYMDTKQLHTFNEEIEHITYYIRLEQLRFGKKTRFMFDFEIEDFLVPTLSIEPLVENAVIHGLGPKEREGTVSIRTFEEDRYICISVEDDGVGYNLEGVDAEKSKGLKNVISRWHYLQNAKIDVSSEIGKGVKILIAIPKVNALAEL